MNILLTNDDGIFSEGIYALYLSLSGIGKVSIVAPDSQRSSVGHGITLSHPIWSEKVKRRNKFFGYGISGTPADCVKFACAVLLKKKPDLIVSGINLGPNDGCSIHYSGTVAGAREGALMGIPSIAISLDTFVNPDYSYAAKFAAKLSKFLLSTSLTKGTFLNVNVPNLKPSQIKGVKVAEQGLKPIHGTFKKRSDPNLKDYYWMSGKLPPHKNSLQDDTQALHKKYVTVTPIQTDNTDYELLSDMNNWNIKK
ncbi:5'-nucleotidase SurE [hydrothermal vent metagenome]|uniref:5'-nucleotidase n=1 Tax=hydrothermal vent metagenome TaxID=652676 RepID=A0A3B0U8D9_9ZZZZ